MTTHLTYCRICEALCGLEVEVEGGRVTRIRPDAEHPVSRGFACVKGTRFAGVAHDPDRVRSPLRRTASGGFEPVSWSVALAEIGAKLRAIRGAHGPDAVGFYFGNPSAFSYAHPLAQQGFLLGLGTRNVFSAGSQDCNNKFVVAEGMFGSPLLQPLPDLAHARTVVLLGTNPAVSQMSFVHAPGALSRLEAVVERGGQVFVVDPRRTETAAGKGFEHVPIRPDTDVFLLAAIGHVLLARDAFDRRVVLAHARGFAALADVLRRIDPEAAVRVTGVPRATIERLADALAKPAACLHVSTGVNQGSHGALAYLLAQAIHLLTGNLDREGGVLVGEHLVDLPKWLARAGLDRMGAPSRVGGFLPVLGTLPATILPDEIRTEGPGKLRALIVTAGNPALSCANSERMQAALSELELLVTVDLYRNETGELAHYVLPTLDFLQREDFPLAFLTFQPEPYLQWTEAVLPVVGQERSEWEIFVDLAHEAGVPFFGVPGLAAALRASRRLGARDPLHPRRSIDAMLRVAGSSLAALRRAPHGVLRPALRPGSFLGARVLTHDGRVDLVPDRLRAPLAALPRTLAAQDAARRADDRLVLFSKREKTSHNSWLHNVEDLVRGRRVTNYAYLHPADAAARGIEDGALVRVSTAVGSVELPARLDADVARGGVAIPHGWGHERAPSLRVASRTSGVDVNRLAPDGPDATDPVAGMTRLTGLPVEVVRVAGGASA